MQILESGRVNVTALLKEGFGLKYFSSHFSLRLEGITNSNNLKAFSFQCSLSSTLNNNKSQWLSHAVYDFTTLLTFGEEAKNSESYYHETKQCISSMASSLLG